MKCRYFSCEYSFRLIQSCGVVSQIIGMLNVCWLNNMCKVRVTYEKTVSVRD